VAGAGSGSASGSAGPLPRIAVRLNIVVTRVLDLAVLALLAVAILMPRPDAKVKPALSDSSPARQRIAELQAQAMADPTDTTTALDLAGVFMDVGHPEWALASLDTVLAAHPDDHRVHLARSLAFVDHFEAGYAYAEAMRALALCEAGSIAPCDESEHGRMVILKNTLDRIKLMDMRRDPNSAKDQILKGLRSTFVPRPRPHKAEGATSKPAPAAAPGAPAVAPPSAAPPAPTK
jgi:hypothetical protein